MLREDIDQAKELMEELMRRSLDELPSQTRRLLGLVNEMVSAECQRLKIERSDFRFSRRDVRAAERRPDRDGPPAASAVYYAYDFLP